MKLTSTILHNHKPTLHPIARSAAFSASLLALERTRNNPTGFVSALAHEIRNPLGNINLALELLDPTKLDDEQRQYLSIIRRASERIKEVSNRLLRLDQTTEINFEVYSLHQLLDEVLVMARDQMSLKNISVTREYTAIAPRVSLDAERVKIALTNIVINAIDAMSSGTGELRLVTRSTNGLSFIEIHDNGIGIGKEDLKRIFEPYFSNKPGGMGIGLSATRDIFRANHTRMDVSSEEGVGTCFTLSFDRE
jgi:signal transduction histidine kinase